MSIKQVQFIEDDLKKVFGTSDIKKLEKLKNSHVCITGGAGFVGLWILEMIHHLNKAHQFNIFVTSLDRDFEKYKKLVPHLFENDKFQLKRTDLRYLVELPKETNFIIHCAGTPDNRAHSTNPVDVMSTCAQGTERVLNATDRLSDFRMFANLTSSLVYGSFDDLSKPVKEGDVLPSGSDYSPYTAGKLYSEVLTASYRQQFRTPSIILRPFTFVGPYQTLTSPWALNNFIHDAIKGTTVKVLGSGKTVRSFLYGADVAYLTLALLVNSESGSVYNLGNHEAVDLSTAAKIVTGSFVSPKEIMYCGGNSNSVKINYMVPDTKKVEASFGVKPVFSSKEAIKRSVEWFTLTT